MFLIIVKKPQMNTEEQVLQGSQQILRNRESSFGI
jgi:hypothetical protein